MWKQKAATALAVVLAVAVAYSRYSVTAVKRSRPENPGFAMSFVPGYGQWGVVQERWGVTEEGLPKSSLRMIYPKNDTLPGAYKGHPSSPPVHFHLYQDEVFTIKRGRFGYVLDGKEGFFEEGHPTFSLPRGVPHTFWNGDLSRDLEVELQAVSREGNATAFADFLETIYGLSRDYGGLHKVPPLQLLLSFQEGANVELVLPKFIRWVVPYVACPLAKLLGYRALYPEYTSIEGK